MNGKYSRLIKNITDADTVLLGAIANELAERNRLKQVELKAWLQHYSGFDQGSHAKYTKWLEDQA